MKTRLISNNAERLVQALERSNVSGAELARKLGLENDQNITNWKTRGVPANKLSAVALALGLRREWLEYGDLPMFLDDAEIVYGFDDRGEAYELASVVPWDNETPMGQDDLEFRFYKEIELSSGSGKTAVQEVRGPTLRFSRESMRECGVDPEHAVFATNSGDSNHPLIPHGAAVGVDKGMTRIIDGELYALDHDGLLRLKFLQRLPGGAVRLKSFNSSDYPDEEYSLDDILEQRLVILGRVFWWAVSRPLRSPRLT